MAALVIVFRPSYDGAGIREIEHLPGNKGTTAFRGTLLALLGSPSTSGETRRGSIRGPASRPIQTKMKHDSSPTSERNKSRTEIPNKQMNQEGLLV